MTIESNEWNYAIPFNSDTYCNQLISLFLTASAIMMDVTDHTQSFLLACFSGYISSIL